MTRTLDDPDCAGCELNPRSSHVARGQVLLLPTNRHTATGWRLGTFSDKDPTRRGCLETRTSVYNAGTETASVHKGSRRVIPTRATSYYPPRYDSRRNPARKVVTTEVAAA